MPVYKNNNHYKVSFKKPDGTLQFLLPGQSMLLPAFYDRYRKQGLITLDLPKHSAIRQRAAKRASSDALKDLREQAIALPRSLRIAVCVSGRSIDVGYSLAYINRLMVTHNVDVYAHVWSESDDIQSNSWSKSKNDVFNTDKLLLELSKLNSVVLKEDFKTANVHFKKLHDQIRLAGGNMSRKDTGAISMYYSIFKANELRRTSGIRHDLVIRMRYDSQPKCDLNMNMLVMDAINIPDEEDFAGINDQFAIGPPNLMDIYAGVYNNIIGLSVQCTHHPELLLRCQLEAHSLPLNRINYPVSIGRNRNS